MDNLIRKSNDQDVIKKTVRLLKAGNIAIISADTVYGAAADPHIPEPLEKIYKVV